jgi:GNAT superfamily N-acetyltransferase
MEIIIANAETSSAILRCYPVMSQLRPHLREEEFVEQITRQQIEGYQLGYLEVGAQIRAVAGYRFFGTLAWGRICYVDDLVTDSESRSQSFGRTLFDWLVSCARDAGCEQFHLDSGVQRFDAHRFYLARRMAISCHHFSMSLADKQNPVRIATVKTNREIEA